MSHLIQTFIKTSLGNFIERAFNYWLLM